MRLVVHILERVTRPRRLRERRQPGAHPVRRQILDGAVILVTPGELARLGDVEIANSPQSRGQVIIHGADRIARGGAHVTVSATADRGHAG
jgi:hypothetical protein